jgi:hypothetical protein
LTGSTTAGANTTPGNTSFPGYSGSYGVGGTTTGNGNPGLVVIEYPTATATGVTITGGTITTSGSNTRHTFTTSGTLAVA